MIRKAKQLVTKSLVKYLVVGVSAFVVEYLTFLVLYKAVLMPVIVSNGLSFLTGLLTSFSLNRIWTFNAKQHQHTKSRQLQMYVLLAAVNLLLTILLVQVFIAIGIAPGISKLVAMVATSCWNFVLFKLAIFKYDD